MTQNTSLEEGQQLDEIGMDSMGEMDFGEIGARRDDNGSRVTGQVGQQIRVGHVGHGSVLVTR